MLRCDNGQPGTGRGGWSGTGASATKALGVLPDRVADLVPGGLRAHPDVVDDPDRVTAAGELHCAAVALAGGRRIFHFASGRRLLRCYSVALNASWKVTVPCGVRPSKDKAKKNSCGTPLSTRPGGFRNPNFL